MNLNFIEVKFKELQQDVNDFIQATYNKSNILLSVADPYGQILGAISSIFSTSMLYLKNVVSQFDINNPGNNNAKMIYAAARIGGYNPGRAISATGTLSLQIQPGIDILTEIPGGELNILNGSKITNKSNNLDYFIDLGVDQINFQLTQSGKVFVPIVQGKVESQTFTGTGEKIQSFSINLPNGQSAENFRVIVRVNGVVWALRDHLYDILPNEQACVTRTGIAGGLDIYFGTGFFGQIPNIGDQIEVRYVVSSGALGNIPHNLTNDFTFVDEVFDKFGATVDLDKNFNVFIENEINMGGNSENPTFTKAILPHVSRNFVMVRPEQYIFQLKRLAIFSQIDAFTTASTSGNVLEDSIVYLFLIPDISLFLQSAGSSYFDLDLSAFILDSSEKTKIETYLRTQGTIGLGTGIKILDPVIQKYITNIFIRIYDDAVEDNIRSNIYNNLSNYFANLQRTGIIPRSDLINIIESIDGINSIDCTFLSEANEAYHLTFQQYKTSIMKSNPTINPDTIKMPGYDPTRVIGLDPQLGDIIYDKDHLPVIRGGWQTRDGVFYNETPQTKGLSSINIQIVSVIKKQTF